MGNRSFTSLKLEPLRFGSSRITLSSHWQPSLSAWGWIGLSSGATARGLWAAWQLRDAPTLATFDRIRLGLYGFVATAATVALLWLIVPADITPDNGDVTSQSMRTIERVFPWGVLMRMRDKVM